MKLLGFIFGAVLLQCSMGGDPMEDPNLFEGDIVLNAQQRESIDRQVHGEASTFGSSTSPDWPKVIPYSIHGNLQRESRAMSAIKAAIADYERHTCLRFKMRSNEPGYLYFQPGGGCSSPVGYWRRKNGITLAGGCWNKGIVIHEIMHSLGFYHEQSRPDRDDYVTINWSNIKSNMKYNFNKYDQTKIKSNGSPYDYGSIMHYGPYGFAINRRVKTIIPKNGASIGQRSGFSKHDIDQLNKRYCRGGGGGGGGGGGSSNCKDNDRRCPGWKDKYCGNHKWVRDNCKKTCGLCSGGGGGGGSNCKDNDRRCPGWKDKYCGNHKWVRDNCKKTCGLCRK